MSRGLALRLLHSALICTLAVPAFGQGSTESLTPTHLNFGNVAVGTPSAAQTVSLNNTGANAITISDISSSGEYSLTSDCPSSPATLPPGGNCSINTVFQPTGLGSRIGTISVSDDADGSPHVISLSGNGVGAAYIWGRDTWIIPGTSHVMRILGNEDLVAPGNTPVITVFPGPVTVNYVVVGSTRDFSVSVTVPAGTPSGSQTLLITDGSLSHVVPDALQVVDAATKNPSPSILPLGGSATLSIAANPLFADQKDFTLDLGPDVSVGNVTLQADGTLQAPVSVTPWAIPGTRSVHLTAGPYTFLAERGFAIDFGPLVNKVTLNKQVVSVPAGYQAGIFVLPDSTNALNTAELCVDARNIAYFLNQAVLPTPPHQFFLSVFDLNASNYGAFLGILPNLDPSGKAGLLEDCAFLPSAPGVIYLTSEDFPPNYPGGHTITAVNTATGSASLFVNMGSNVNIDPIDILPNGNMVVAGSQPAPSYGGVYLIDPSGTIIKNCPINGWADEMHVDPLTGLILANGPVSINQRGFQNLDIATCKTSLRSDGPVNQRFDEGDFAPSAGDFGNQFFVSVESDNPIYTFVPVPYTDPAQSTPERYVTFATGMGQTDTARFDREGKHLLVIDVNHNAVDVIDRIPGYQPSVAIASLSSPNLDFATQLVGTTSKTQTLTLTNRGAAALTIAGIGITGDFDRLSDCPIAPASLAVSESCSIYVSFTPSVVGRSDGTIVLTNSANSQPQVITLLGLGKDFDLQAVSSSATILAGTPTATFTVSTSPGASYSGQVALSCSGAPLANCSFNPPAISAGQTSTLTLTGLAGNSGGTTISFSAVGTLGAQSSSVPLFITVTDFSISAVQSAATINSGQSTSYTLTLASLGGFDQAVALQCTGAPTTTTCSLGQTSVNFNGVTSATVQVTVNTTARSFVGIPEGPSTPKLPFRIPVLPAIWFALLGLFLTTLIPLSRKKGPIRARLVFASLTIAVLTWMSCGGGGGGGTTTTTPPPQNGTPAGTYSLTVTGTYSGSAGSLTHATSLSLTVR